jgi:thioredoxin reductase
MTNPMYELIIIGAGPGGIALAAEGNSSGVASSQILVLEKAPTHNSAIRQLYPLGGTTPTNFLHTLGIAFDGDGPVFDNSGATNVEGLYLIGDLVVGKKGGSIITAFNSAVRAMKSICTHYLPCKPLTRSAQ